MEAAKYFILFFMLSVVSACVDTEEYIVINDDNSGMYTVTMDMGKVLGMLSKMGGEEMNSSGGMDKIDSTIYFKDLVDKADSLSAAEKELYRNAIVHIKLDKSEEAMKITMSCPFKSIDLLPEIKNNFFTIMNKIKAFDKLPGDKDESADLPVDNGMAEKALTPNAAYFEFTAVPGKIEYSIKDTAGFKNLVSTDSTINLVQQMTAMLGEITYKTRITTVREIKHYHGNKATLSADKKTVIFNSSFSEMLENPGKSAYKIEY
jgi:hypothetical protein